MTNINEIYLNSDILIGFTDGSTWLLTDDADQEKQAIPNRHTLIITACNPRSERTSMEDNLFATQELARKLTQRNLNYTLGWGKDRGNAVAEISFCIEVPEPEARDAITHELLDLAKEFGQNAIFEVINNEVTVIDVKTLSRHTRTKPAKRIEETQAELEELFKALNWATDPSEKLSQSLTDLINDLKEKN